MTSTQDVRTPSVRTQVTVALPPAEAFALFTEGIGTWWPTDTYRIGESEGVAVLEPREGGRWYERAPDGVECDWGRVLAWEPPHRVLLAWQLNATWQYDADFVTEVEVRFTEDGAGGTRVDLEHRHIDRFGDAAEQLAAALGGDGGWPAVLARYVAAAA